MYIEHKNEIITVLVKLEEAVARGKEGRFIQDPENPSLYLWFKYLEFMQDVFDLYDSERNNKEVEFVCGLVEGFMINPKENYEISKKPLEDYIKQIYREKFE